MKKLIILVACCMIAANSIGQDLKPKQGGNERWGYVNSQGKTVIDFQYINATDFSEGLAAVKSSKQYKWGYINDKGKIVIKCKYDDATPFKHGFAGVKVFQHWGIIDDKGKRITEYAYDDVEICKVGLIKVSLNGKEGFVNFKGEQIVDCIYDEIYDFKLGLAPVLLNGKWGYINTNGELIADCIYDKVYLFQIVGLTIVELNGKYGIINTNGEFIADCIYDEVYAFSEDFAIVQLNGKYGFINTKGKRIDCIYDHALAFRNGFAQVQLNGKWGFINTEGKWFDTKEQGERWWYMNQPFSQYAKSYVETRINEWQKKGEFEKTADWQARVNEQTREQKIAEYVKQAEQQFITERSKETKYSYTLGQYDADNEVYLVKCNDKELLVPIPISEASAFKSSWSSIVKTPKFFIENDRLSVAEVTFRMPNGKTYKYSNAASLNYTVAQVDYNFDPIELDLPIGTSRPAGQQNISTVNVSVGKADVDTDIPQCKRSNDRTFAVIVANENYSKLAKVPFALNDGKTFCEYCRRTLGLPQSNIRFYGDATYGTMLAAVNDIEKIAAAYNGDIRVIFYYAGHGAPNESTQEAFLMPVDAYGVGTEACYSLDRLYNELGALGAKNVTVFLDACFSGSTRDGAMLASARGVAIKPKAVSPHGNMVVFSAASADETALPYNDKGHGLFTYFLLKKLQQSEGNVTFGELGDYITEQVRQKSTVVNRKSQTPTVTVAPALAQTWKSLGF